MVRARQIEQAGPLLRQYLAASTKQLDAIIQQSGHLALQSAIVEPAPILRNQVDLHQFENLLLRGLELIRRMLAHLTVQPSCAS